MAAGARPQSASTAAVLTHRQEGITTLTLNRPGQLNGWTMETMAELLAALRAAARDDETGALILTGTGPYYCAGVNLAGVFRLQHPRKLHATIAAFSQALFDAFLDFPKPLLVAVNGPAIGASVTSATLCDGIIASEKATFSTPFAALKLPPEGCSSVHLARLVGPENAARMLGGEGWQPTAAEALEAGLVQWVVRHQQLGEEARRIARGWIASGAGRSFRGGSTRDELKAVNARESVALADAFLSAPLLRAQSAFLWRKKKVRQACVLRAALITRPLWSRLLRKRA